MNMDWVAVLLLSVPIVLLSFPLGLFLYLWGSYYPKPPWGLMQLLFIVVRGLQSMPLMVLLFLKIFYDTFHLGTGSLAILAHRNPHYVVLVLSAFFALAICQLLRQLDIHLIDNSVALGASCWQLVYYIIFPELKLALLCTVLLVVAYLLMYSSLAALLMRWVPLDVWQSTASNHHLRTNWLLGLTFTVTLWVQLSKTISMMLLRRSMHHAE